MIRSNKKNALDSPRTTFDIKSGAGFTLLELILVVMTLGFISYSSLLVFSNQQLGNLESDAEIIATRLSEAQYRAIAGIEGSPWGIYFNNATATPYYALFSGFTYIAPSSTYYLSGIVEFGTPASGTSTEVVFQKYSGLVSSSASVVIRLKTDASLTKTITVSSQGTVTVE